MKRKLLSRIFCKISEFAERRRIIKYSNTPSVPVGEFRLNCDEKEVE